jgi:hypothetical protein
MVLPENAAVTNGFPAKVEVTGLKPAVMVIGDDDSSSAPGWPALLEYKDTIAELPLPRYDRRARSMEVKAYWPDVYRKIKGKIVQNFCERQDRSGRTPMRMTLWVSMTVLCICFSCYSTPSPKSAAKLRCLDQTHGLLIDSGLNFSISPNDKWLVFFKRDDSDSPARPDVHELYGLLRVMNLKTLEIHAFTVREDQGPRYPIQDVDAVWAEDSSLCVMPPPGVADRRIAISFASEKPTVAFLPDPRQPAPSGSDASGQQIKLPERLTCSDCCSHSSDFDLYKKHLPEQLIIGDAKEADNSAQAVSSDKTKIWFQEGPQAVKFPAEFHTTTLFQLEIATGAKTTLVKHDGDCPRISRLRPSPDGKKLAYQLGGGCGFAQIPEIYVLDFATGKSEYIALGSGMMHWSKSSDKLFFYRRWTEGEHVDALWVAEFGKSERAQSRP